MRRAVPELLHPFGRLHVLLVGVIACFGLAAASPHGLWLGLGLGGALAGSVWTGLRLRHDRARRRAAR